MASLKLSALLLVLALGCALAARNQGGPDVRAAPMKDHHHNEHYDHGGNYGAPPHHDEYHGGDYGAPPHHDEYHNDYHHDGKYYDYNGKYGGKYNNGYYSGGYGGHHDDHHHESKCPKACICPLKTNYCDGECLKNTINNCGSCGVTCAGAEVCGEFPVRVTDLQSILHEDDDKRVAQPAPVDAVDGADSNDAAKVNGTVSAVGDVSTKSIGFDISDLFHGSHDLADVIQALADLKYPQCPNDKRSEWKCCLPKNAACVNAGPPNNPPCCNGLKCINSGGFKCLPTYPVGN